MSEALHVLRVYFDGGRGMFTVLGWRQQLEVAPLIPGLPRLTAIDFDYTTSCYRCLPHMGEWRDLMLDEVHAVVAWLRMQYNGQRMAGGNNGH